MLKNKKKVTFFNYPTRIQIDKLQVVEVYGHGEVTKLRYLYIYKRGEGQQRQRSAPKNPLPPEFEKGEKKMHKNTKYWRFT